MKLNAASKIAYECNASMIGASTRSLCKIEKFCRGWMELIVGVSDGFCFRHSIY